MRKGRGTLLETGKGGWAGSRKVVMAFHGLKPCQERKGVFLLPVVLCYGPLKGMSAPTLASRLYLIEVSVY